MLIIGIPILVAVISGIPGYAMWINQSCFQGPRPLVTTAEATFLRTVDEKVVKAEAEQEREEIVGYYFVENAVQLEAFFVNEGKGYTRLKSLQLASEDGHRTRLALPREPVMIEEGKSARVEVAIRPEAFSSSLAERSGCLVIAGICEGETPPEHELYAVFSRGKARPVPVSVKMEYLTNLRCAGESASEIPTSPCQPVSVGPEYVPLCAATDCNCGDFAAWDEAQTFFEAVGGPEKDPHRLDYDNDGIACESLPGAP